MRKFTIMKISVDYPEYIDVHEIEDHMLHHKGVAKFYIDTETHSAVIMINRMKTNWAKTKHEMEKEGLRVMGSSITGVQ